MALRSRRRDSSLIWPGFVDAVTTLLMVMIFVLTIFTVMQSVLRDEVTNKTNELTELNQQIAGLADALGLERARSAELTATGQQQAAQIADLSGQLATRQGQLDAANSRIAGFEAQVASLLAERDSAREQVATLDAAQSRLISDKEALDLALAKARSEIDAGAEAARLAAARREALEALIADLRKDAAAGEADLAAAQTRLSDAEKDRLADQAALAALQERLSSSDTELTAMTLALEEQRKRAEETLTLLAAADAARNDAARQGGETATALEQARKILTEKDQELLASAQRLALLNQQIAALRGQLGDLQGLLDASSAKDADAKVQIDSLGSQLNAALAQVAAEQKRRAELEEAERKRVEAEKQDLERFRSEFFGQLSQLLAGREGVRVVGDRFVFSSEVLFAPGSADLLPEGRAQIAGVVQTLNEIAAEIPPSIDWIIRVDGHTDNVPLSGLGEFKDNWQLSSARALSVVRFMQDDLGFPPSRLAATGFGEYRPVAQGDSAEARAQNRRIELKLTER